MKVRHLPALLNRSLFRQAPDKAHMFFAITRPFTSNASVSRCCYWLSLNRQYSTRPSRRDWHVAGHPAPQIVEVDEEQAEMRGGAEDHSGTTSKMPYLRRKPSKVPTPHEIRAHRETLKSVFPDGWSPPHKLSREAMEGLRSLHAYDESTFSTPVLAEKFKISPEAVRRILKSKWEPSREQRAKFAERERNVRFERIMAKRMREKLQHLEIEAASGRMQAEKEERLPWRKTKHPRARLSPMGIDEKDRFTFQ